MELHPPRAVRDIAQRLEEAGHEAWAVGGAVRDALLDLPGGDWDLATSAEPKQVRRLFRRTVPIGIEHGTVGVLGADDVLYEVTTFRRDVETFGRHAVVEFAQTIDEDLARRDFTFNALAWRPTTGELRDPFGGVADLHGARLRTVGKPEERFSEDYLRVLRALRFAGHFRLAIEPATWTTLCLATALLTHLSAERVREELWKILTKTRLASAALSLYGTAGVLRVLYPELEATVGLHVGEDPRDVWTVSLLAVDTLPPARPLLRVAALLHGIGRAPARVRRPGGGYSYAGHEALAGRKAAGVLRRLKASNVDVERVTRLVSHQGVMFAERAPDAVVRRWLRQVGPDLVPDLFRLRFALCRAQHRIGDDGAGSVLGQARRARATLHRRPPLGIEDLAIGGAELKQLGLEPGPRFGAILRSLLERVLDEPELNTKDALLELVRQELDG